MSIANCIFCSCFHFCEQLPALFIFFKNDAFQEEIKCGGLVFHTPHHSPPPPTGFPARVVAMSTDPLGYVRCGGVLV